MSAAEITVGSRPEFAHAQLPELLDPPTADATLAWFQSTAPWRLRIASFYEQSEFSLLGDEPPPHLRCLTTPAFINELKSQLTSSLSETSDLELTEIAAHKLTPGQTIRIHNDYIGGEETHRILIQLNDGWSIDNGGLLMLFGSDNPEDVRTIVVPKHRSCFAFEISPKSYHAVSRIIAGDRYTLVYTFRRQ